MTHITEDAISAILSGNTLVSPRVQIIGTMALNVDGHTLYRVVLSDKRRYAHGMCGAFASKQIQDDKIRENDLVQLSSDRLAVRNGQLIIQIHQFGAESKRCEKKLGDPTKLGVTKRSPHCQKIPELTHIVKQLSPHLPHFCHQGFLQQP